MLQQDDYARYDMPVSHADFFPDRNPNTVTHRTPTPIPTPVPTAAPRPVPSPTPTPVPSPTPTTACTWIVSVTGSARGNGSITQPWSLRYIANGFVDFGGTAPPAAIKPGNDICIRAGTYRGLYRITFSGTKTAQITVRPYPGERVIIDDGTVYSSDSPQSGTLEISGSYVTVRDLEFTNSNPDRTSARLSGISIDQFAAAGAKVINNIVHDAGGMISKNDLATDVEIYGNVGWNNGWDDRNTGLRQGGTGHGIYASNRFGYFRDRENITVNGFGFGQHLYSAGVGTLNNVEVAGNVSADNGYWTRIKDSPYAPEGRSTTNFLVGHRPITNLIFKNNFGFHREGRIGMNSEVGYSSSVDNPGPANVSGNVLVGGSNSVSRFSSLTVENNFIASNWSLFQWTPPKIRTQHTINSQTYYFYPSDCERQPFVVMLPDANGELQEVTQSVAQWKARGFDANSMISSCGIRPSGVRVDVRANTYDSKRFHVIVNNFSKASTVRLDLISALKVGDQFELRNVQDYLGAPVASGVYNGPISVNMNGLNVATPIGWNNTMTLPALLTSGPAFGAFVLTKK